MPSEVAIITGASNGIGLATARLLAEKGYAVYATCRSPEKALELQKVMQQFSNLNILKMDVNSNKSVNGVVEEIYRKEGKIDCVINNAGFGIYGPSEIHTIDEMQSIFNTNVLGVMRVNQAVIPIMRKQLHGRIINLSSIAGAVPSKNLPIYSASKAALESLSASDAHVLDRWKIKVSLIQPGATKTNFEASTPFGSRFNNIENPYQEFLEENRGKWKKMMDDGQSASDVAEVIHTALKDPQPRLWYQTSHHVKEEIGKHFKDLTGNGRIPQLPLPIKAKL